MNIQKRWDGSLSLFERIVTQVRPVIPNMSESWRLFSHVYESSDTGSLRRWLQLFFKRAGRWCLFLSFTLAQHYKPDQKKKTVGYIVATYTFYGRLFWVTLTESEGSSFLARFAFYFLQNHWGFLRFNFFPLFLQQSPVIAKKSRDLVYNENPPE